MWSISGQKSPRAIVTMSLRGTPTMRFHGLQSTFSMCSMQKVVNQHVTNQFPYLSAIRVKPYYWKAVPGEWTFCLPQPARSVHQHLSLWSLCSLWLKTPPISGVCQQYILDKQEPDTRFDQCLQGFRVLKKGVTMTCTISAVYAIIRIKC